MALEQKLIDLMYTGYVVIYVKDGQVLDAYTVKREKIDFLAPKE